MDLDPELAAALVAGMSIALSAVVGVWAGARDAYPPHRLPARESLQPADPDLAVLLDRARDQAQVTVKR